MGSGHRFWFDLENAPDVLFFEPIITELRRRGHEALTTTRPFSSVPELAQLYGIGGQPIGRHGGSKKWAKVAFGLARSAGLMRWSRGRRIDLAVGFGSRPLAVACAGLRKPNATVFDYEHVSVDAFNRFCQWIFVPEEVSVDYLVDRGSTRGKLMQYSGLKEEVYTAFHQPTNGLRAELGIAEHQILVVLRPPATAAHYHDPTGEKICFEVLERACASDDVYCLLLRRDGEELYDHYLTRPNVHQLPFPVKGLDLVAIADVVISGGGTMVREAAALGVPSFSIFTGVPGAVDKRLASEGRMSLVRHPDEVDKIRFTKRPTPANCEVADTSVRDFFVDRFIECAGAKR